MYTSVGGGIGWGKHQAWPRCISATGAGDATDSAVIWSQPLEEHRCCTLAISNALIFVCDCGRNIRCLDAKTGRPCQGEPARMPSLRSPLDADGNVFTGAQGRWFREGAASKSKN